MSKHSECSCEVKGRKHFDDHGCKTKIISKFRDMLEKNETLKGSQMKAANTLEIMENLFFRQCGRALYYTEPKLRAVIMAKLDEFKRDPRVGHLFVDFDLLAKQIAVLLEK